ncbi:MAG: hypothetical protein IPF70_16165 [Saprospiraceae bacterium]|nr:hypothetical protein [Saprospiraceae bacterium]
MKRNPYMDFGFIELYSWGNLVWEDANNNGLYDGGEMPLTGDSRITFDYNPANSWIVS